MSRHDHKDNQKEAQRLAQSSEQKRKNTFKLIKKVALWIVIIVVLLAGFQYVLSLTKIDVSNLPKLVVSQVGTTDHTTGDGKILVIEYSDFQCPACATNEISVARLLEEYGDNITFVYRHFPLRSIHRHAQTMAQASEAAAAQGKFREFSHALFESQDSWKNLGSVKDYAIQRAKDFGMNVSQFEADMYSQAVKAKVENDYQSGIRNNVQGTPSFFINGQRIQFKTYEELASVIRRLQ